MRHSDPSLTANVYTDPRLLDIAGALDALPTLPLIDPPAAQRATGTCAPGSVALAVAPAGGDSCQDVASGVSGAKSRDSDAARASLGGCIDTGF
jgi:hypothetical protein